MPAAVLGTYGPDGTADGMTAAWAGAVSGGTVGICLSAGHSTTKNILRTGEFSLSPATAGTWEAADWLGCVSASDVPDKVALSGLHPVKCPNVDAPAFAELPLVLECRMLNYDDESGLLTAEIVNTAADESVLGDNGLPDWRKTDFISFDPVTGAYLAGGEKRGDAFTTTAPLPQVRVSVEPETVLGPVKPLHGINNAPFLPGADRWMYLLKEANIPSVRLHDTMGEFGGARYVDVPNIFPDFSADENDPASYSFFETDKLLCAIKKAGADVFYRLGVSIENAYGGEGPVYRIYPPEDPEKWARVCEHIVMHYNDGWADGYRLGIKYWEIWNEPDNEPEISKNPQWRGTMEQFFELYRLTSTRLKNHWPDLKIGGYASCGFYHIADIRSSESANVSPRNKYFVDFFEAFLKYVTAPDTRCPLDFFSWHSYADVKDTAVFARYARAKLDEYGLVGTESVFNEWNMGPWRRGTLEDAALIASMIIAMAGEKVDLMNFYTGAFNGQYAGLFDPVHRDSPHPSYYVLKAYGELYAEGKLCRSTPDADDVKVLSSPHKTIVCSRAKRTVNVTVDAGGLPVKAMRLIDSRRRLEAVPAPVDNSFTLQPDCIALIEY